MLGMKMKPKKLKRYDTTSKSWSRFWFKSWSWSKSESRSWSYSESWSNSWLGSWSEYYPHFLSKAKSWIRANIHPKSWKIK